MPLEFIGGKLIQVEQKPETAVGTITEANAQEIIKSVESQRMQLPLPDYTPDDKRDVVIKYQRQMEEEAWQKVIGKWKTTPNPTGDNLLALYKSELQHHFLTTRTLLPARNPGNITENTYAISDNVVVNNVVNCTGGILEGTHNLGFHILGFTKVDNLEDPISPEAAERIGKYIDQIIDIMGEPPTKITINASTLGKGIGNLDLGHEFVERLLKEKLFQKFPDTYINSKAIQIERVRSMRLSTSSKI